MCAVSGVPKLGKTDDPLTVSKEGMPVCAPVSSKRISGDQPYFEPRKWCYSCLQSAAITLAGSLLGGRRGGEFKAKFAPVCSLQAQLTVNNFQSISLIH